MAAYHSAEEMTKLLKVSASTLRKYALLLEKAGYEIDKNRNGQRWYKDGDIMAFNKLIAFSKGGAMTLEEAATAVYLWSIGGDVARLDTNQAAPPPAMSEMAEKLFDRFEAITAAADQQQEQHRQDIEKLTAAIQQQAEEMGAMRALLEQLTAEKETAAALTAPEAEKKSFLRRIFG